MNHDSIDASITQGLETMEESSSAFLQPDLNGQRFLNSNSNMNDTPPHGFAVTIDILTVALLASAFFYVICFRLAQHKLQVLHELQPQMTTKKLLILSVLLVSVLRIMTILGVATMNMANVRAHYSLQPNHSHGGGDKTQDFYDEAMTVLFDLPNCIVVSTYVLLTLVWAECFLEARFHTENSVYWKQRLLILFMLFNTLLYATQLILYTCIFFSGSHALVRAILYAAITGISFVAVALVLSFYIYLNIRFSGFPYRSEEQRASLARVSSVMTLWSVTRVIWGVATLLVYVYNVELLQDTDTPLWSFVVLFVVFFVCEIIPIVILLDYSYYMHILRGVAGARQQQTQQSQTQEPPPTIAMERHGEADSLLLQRPLQTMDHLLLTSPHAANNNNNTSSDPSSTSRRVRFLDASPPTQDTEDPAVVEVT